MTPAINLARQQKIPHNVHEYEHDANCSSWGAEAAEKLGIARERVFKTLVVCLDDKALAVCVLPVAGMLSMKLAASALGAKKAAMAAKADVERSTGYVLGGVSPLGQKKKLPTLIDVSACTFPSVFVSAGRRGLEIELSPQSLQELCAGVFTALCQQS